MKKIVRLLLAITLCLGLTACGSRQDTPGETGTDTTASADTRQTEPVLAEQVVYEEGGIRITVRGMEENTMTGTDILILLENGTDRNVIFSGDLFIVNGVTMPGYLYAQAAAGTKANDTIELHREMLEAAGIGAVRTVAGYDARIVDADTYETLARVPLELTTVYAGQDAFPPEQTGVELYRDQGITVIAQTLTEEFYGQTAQLLVKNDTGRNMIVEAEHIVVNGYTVDAWLYDTVAADTVRYCQLDLFETGLAENGIDRIDTVSFQLNFLDAESFETIAQSEVLTVEVMG